MNSNLVLNSLIKKGTISAKQEFFKGEDKPLRGLCMLLREIINTKGDINLFDKKLIKSLNFKSQDDLLEYYYSLLFRSGKSWLYDPYKVCVLYDLDKDAYIDTILYVLNNKNFNSVYDFIEEVDFLDDKLHAILFKF